MGHRVIPARTMQSFCLPSIPILVWSHLPIPNHKPGKPRGDWVIPGARAIEAFSFLAAKSANNHARFC